MCAVSMRVRFAKMYWLGMTVCGRIAVESGPDLLPFCGTLLGSASLTRNCSHMVGTWHYAQLSTSLARCTLVLQSVFPPVLTIQQFQP